MKLGFFKKNVITKDIYYITKFVINVYLLFNILNIPKKQCLFIIVIVTY